MIEYLAMNELRPVGKQWELKQFNKYVAPHLNSVEQYLALLICRFAWDKDSPVLFINLPKEGDEPIAGMKILRDMTKDEFMQVYNTAYAFALANFGEVCGMEFIVDTNVAMLFKIPFLDGDWRNYEYYLTGKDGISIPCK